jgi:hypothetical protein
MIGLKYPIAPGRAHWSAPSGKRVDGGKDMRADKLIECLECANFYEIRFSHYIMLSCWAYYERIIKCDVPCWQSSRLPAFHV